MVAAAATERKPPLCVSEIRFGATVGSRIASRRAGGCSVSAHSGFSSRGADCSGRMESGSRPRHLFLAISERDSPCASPGSGRLKVARKAWAGAQREAGKARVARAAGTPRRRGDAFRKVGPRPGCASDPRTRSHLGGAQGRRQPVRRRRPGRSAPALRAALGRPSSERGGSGPRPHRSRSRAGRPGR